MAGISSKASAFGGAENKKKYNGIEFNDDLNPQTGRWVIEEENNPDLYHFEDRSSNRSHAHEKKD